MTRNALGKAAGLEPKGAYVAANRLIREGILRLEGRGSRQQVALELRHPLARPLQEIFWAERNRVDDLIKAIREAARSLSETVDAAWIEGAFARNDDRPAQPLTVGVLVSSKAVGVVDKELRTRLESAESTADVTIDLAAYTRPDLETAKPVVIRRLESAIPLFGPPPVAYTPVGRNLLRDSKPALRDREKLQALLASVIADRILHDPAKVEAARRFVKERLTTASDQERHELLEWDSILRSMSSARLYQFLRDPGERASRLRQSLPFLDVLSQKERDEILRTLHLESVRNDAS